MTSGLTNEQAAFILERLRAQDSGTLRYSIVTKSLLIGASVFALLELLHPSLVYDADNDPRFAWLDSVTISAAVVVASILLMSRAHRMM